MTNFSRSLPRLKINGRTNYATDDDELYHGSDDNQRFSADMLPGAVRRGMGIARISVDIRC